MLSDKKLEKVIKAIGLETKSELDALGEAELKAKVVQANQSMKDVEDELDANEDYQNLLANKSAMEQGKKDVDKRQKAIVKYSLHRLSGE